MAVTRKRITKNGVRYDVDFTYQGRRYIWSTKTGDPKVAKQILGEIQGQIARGAFNLLDPKKKDVTLGEFRDRYIAYAQTYKRESTMVIETTYLEQFTSFAGKGRNIRSIDASMLAMWKAKFVSRDVSPATFNIALRSLHSIFATAGKWQLIDGNPFDAVEKLKVPERRLFLLDGEVLKLFALIEADVNQPNLRPKVYEFRRRFSLYVKFLLNTGLRRDEALKLRPRDIDWDRNVFFVEKTKTKQMRAIPLNSRAQEILRALDDDLFGKLHPAVVTEKFREYLHKAGLTGFKLHSLRHTFSCRLLAAGVDLYTISRLLGHTDIKTTMVYAKMNMTLLKSAVDKLEKGEWNLIGDGRAEER